MIAYRSLFALTLCAAALVGAAGCDEKLADVGGPTPGLAPTFAAIQRDIFQSTDSSGRVACTQCHTTQGRTPPLGLSLLPDAAYQGLLNVPSAQKAGAIRVIPGDPDNSYLVQKLEGHSSIVGQRMPRTSGPFLTEGQMLIIRRWIAQGAANN
ncbi:MAG TPA: hypothetical protein VMF13_08435 [Luteitalea sp.]|nr:hypothetical protein [Luteitalea sp.]